MGIFQDYDKFRSDFTYCDTIVKEVISIFEGSGKSQIITKDIIKESQKKVKDFLILSAKMESALNYIYDQLKEIKTSEIKFSGSMFYFCRYGGSKTQFLHLIINEIQEKIPDCIVLLFEDITELNPLKLFNKLKQSAYYTIPNLARFKNDERKYINLIDKLESISADINVDLRQSSNVNKIIQEIGFVKNRLSKNPELKKKLKETMRIIKTSLFVDSESIMKKILEIMKELTRQGFIFLFLYDELDLWINETTDQLLFSEKFKKLENILKYLFEISQREIKLFHLFACTDRVNTLINMNRYTYSEASSAGSRLIQIYDRSEKVLESGNYGEKIEEALSKISAFFHHSNDKIKINEVFLIKTLNKLKEKYFTYSRRLANDQIIKILKIYHNLNLPLKKGLIEWENNVKEYSNLMHEYLDRILKEIEIKFTREDILIDPEKNTNDKIDGYFINYDEEENEIKSHAEIKLVKKFSGDKVYQALQWSQVRKNTIIMIVFCPDNLENIHKEIIKYAEKNGFTSEDTKRIKILNIPDPYAFCPIIGIKSVMSNFDKLLEFYRNFGRWLDFFGDFNRKYQEIRAELGFSYIKTIKHGETKEKKLEKKREDKELPLESKLCMDLLVKLFKERKMNATGRLKRTTIDGINKKYSLGISDIEKLYEVMGNYNIITNIYPVFIQFSNDILKIKQLEEFIKKCENKFRKKPEGLLSYA